MINRIETLFQPKLMHINNKYENLKDMHMYNDQQLHEIEKGIMSDIDIRYYLGEHFDANQMYQNLITYGIQEKYWNKRH